VSISWSPFLLYQTLLPESNVKECQHSQAMRPELSPCPPALSVAAADLIALYGTVQDYPSVLTLFIVWSVVLGVSECALGSIAALQCIQQFCQKQLQSFSIWPASEVPPPAPAAARCAPWALTRLLCFLLHPAGFCNPGNAVAVCGDAPAAPRRSFSGEGHSRNIVCSDT
jgi:hypothetical protein